jgi:hypothetical protein
MRSLPKPKIDQIFSQIASPIEVESHLGLSLMPGKLPQNPKSALAAAAAVNTTSVGNSSQAVSPISR